MSEKPTPPLLESQRRACPECQSDQLIRDYDSAEIVCSSCGFVLDEQIADTGPEWRAFNAEQRSKRTRVGAPLTYTIHDKGLSTVIDWRNKDTYGKSLPADQRAQVYRLRKWQRRSRVSEADERNLAMALSELSKMSTTLNLPSNIVETASVIYRKAMKRSLIKGRSIQGVAAASAYMACRKCGVTRSLDEISHAAGMDKKKVGRAYRFMVRELREVIPPSLPKQYISRFVNQLKLSGDTEMLAIRILQVVKSKHLTSGKGPLGIAASATYIASVLTNNRRTQREVAEVADITEVTIRNRYKELFTNLSFTIKV
jgi:transcription initiation factor TFIIB